VFETRKLIEVELAGVAAIRRKRRRHWDHCESC
jgi:hypothetical protein